MEITLYTKAEIDEKWPALDIAISDIFRVKAQRHMVEVTSDHHIIGMRDCGRWGITFSSGSGIEPPSIDTLIGALARIHRHIQEHP